MQNSIGPDYQIREFLGRGGMGAVYRAIQPALGDRNVAIKALPKELSESPSFARLFRREAAVLANLTHPNIVTVHDFGTTPDGHLFFVMEYMEGTDLQQLCKASGLTNSQIFDLMNQIMDAVHYIHSRGYVHRDIKPSNIFVNADGTAKLGDFGLSMLLSEMATSMSPNDSHQPLVNFVVGTPGYAAPEQSLQDNNTESDHRADIYSVGITFNQILCKNSTHTDAAKRKYKAIIEKATAHDPQKRFSDIAELRQAMLAAQKPSGSRLLPLWIAFFLTLLFVVFSWAKFFPGQSSRESISTADPFPEISSTASRGQSLTNLTPAPISESAYPLPILTRPTIAGEIRIWRHSHFDDLHDEAVIPSAATATVQISANTADFGTDTGHVLALSQDGKVIAWGSNRLGQSDVPDDLPPVVRVLAGKRFSAVVTEDGTVRVWGDTKNLGDVTAFCKDVAEIAPLSYGFVVLRADGQARMFGFSSHEKNSKFKFNKDYPFPKTYALWEGDWEKGGWFVALADGHFAHAAGPYPNPRDIDPPKNWMTVVKVDIPFALNADGAALKWRGANYYWQPIARNIQRIRAVDNLAATRGGPLLMDRNLSWSGPGIDFLDAAKPEDQISIQEFLTGAIDVTFGKCHAFAIFPHNRTTAILALEEEWENTLRKRRRAGVVLKE